MRCRNCGRWNPEGQQLCKGCGMILRQDFVAMRPAPKRRSAKTIILVVFVVVVIVVIGIPALLYLMVSGFGPKESPPGPVAVLEDVAISGGVMIKVRAISSNEVSWDDVMMTLSSGTGSASWRPRAAEFVADSGASTYFGGPQTLGAAQMWLNITDSGSNGRIGGDDYLTVRADAAGLADSTIQYTLRIVFEIYGSEVGLVTFHF